MRKIEKGSDDYRELLPDEVPEAIRCYDNGGETIDRYTVVFAGKGTYLAMNGRPFHPQGFGQHGEFTVPFDIPNHDHIGKKIKFQDLPEDCQTLVLSDYKELWSLE